MADDALVLRGDCGGVFRCWQCWCGVGGVRWLRNIAVVLVALYLVWSQLVQPSHEHRFRIILDVDTPEGPRRGSSVWSVTCTEPLRALRDMSGGCQLRGEAVFLDLPNGRSIVALMATGPKAQGVDLYDIASLAFGFKHGVANGYWYAQAPKWTGARPLPVGAIPTLVTFTDLNNPASAKVVYATGYDGKMTAESYAGSGIVLINDFRNAFGPGYAFKGATLEMVPVGWWPFNLIGITGTPVTRGIEGKIPVAIQKMDEDRKVFRIFGPNDPYRAMLGQFKR
jgi:hypothetical protein